MMFEIQIWGRIMTWNIAHRFEKAADRHPDNLALAAGQTRLSYLSLKQLAQAVAAQVKPALRQARIGVLGSR
ncbi:MAG: hypothetical protein U1A06_11625, partial [Hoeflea sp.]|nr:hypothetical protein [Hoeflea sp.]